MFAYRRFVPMGSYFGREFFSLSTYMARPSDITRKWYVIDAKGKPLGRVATVVATLLRGKHKPTYTPHMDTGDHVIVINAAAVVLTGRKLDQKIYFHHSGYPGGLKRVVYRNLMQRKPEFVMEKAVRGMLPKNSLGRQMFRKLHVYKGPEHKQQAQQPEIWEVK